MTSNREIVAQERQESQDVDSSLAQKKQPRRLRYRSLLWCGAGLTLILFIAYGWAYLHGWKFSFTNVNYQYEPFDSSGVATDGPSLTDPADNILPIAWSTFHPLAFIRWLSNFSIGCAQSINVYLSPLNYLYVLPLSVAQCFISIIKVSVAFVCMTLFVRQLGYSWRGAFISGASYGFCSVMIMWNGWQHSEVTMYAPLLFLLMDKALVKLKVGYFLGAGVVIFLMLVAGMPTYSAYFLYLVGVYVLFYGIRYCHKQPNRLMAYFIGFSVAVVLAVLLSFPYTSSLLSTVGSNGYASSRAHMSGSRLPWSNLSTLFFPYLPTGSGIHMTEGTLYAGALSVLSIPFVFVRFRDKKRVGFFLTTAVVTFLLVFTPALDVVFRHLPMINTSLKFRVLVLLVFALSVLVGANIDGLVTEREFSPREKQQIVIATFIGLAGFAAMLCYEIPAIREIQAGESSQLYRTTHVAIACCVAAAFALIVVIRLFTARKFVVSVCAVIMSLSVCFDMGYFASHYFPWIQQSASTIPTPTDTVRYLQKNTKHQEKILTKGSWTFFPASNMYYGLRDVNGHGFIFTDKAVRSYYESINPQAFDHSPTRPYFGRVSNENLLKYMGVKYVVGDPLDVGQDMPFSARTRYTRVLGNGTKFIQEFTADNSGLNTLTFPINNDKNRKGTLTLNLYDKQGHLLVSQTQKLKGSEQGSAVFEFSPLQQSKGKSFRLEISAKTKDGKGIDLFTDRKDMYPGDSKLSTGKKTGDLALVCGYNNLREGSDGMSVRQLDDYAPQVELIDEVKVKNTDKQVLEAMSKSFDKNRLYLSKESVTLAKAKDSGKIALESNERISNVDNQRNGNISFDVNTNRQRYVLINEYNDGNWTAYVDGKKTDLYKGNYLFRAVNVPSGKHHVELRYEPKVLKVSCIIAGAGVLLVTGLFLARKSINRKLETLGGE